MTPATLKENRPLAKERMGDLAQRTHMTTLATGRPSHGFIRPACSCGWAGDERDPYDAGAYAAARDDAHRHQRDVDRHRLTQ